MRSGFLPARVIHLHPTLGCNLACAHCYSESAPGIREALDVDRVLGALARLRDQGYEIVSISGGEPLVYADLDRLVEGAAALGLRVHMITNGLQLTEDRIATLRDHVFLVGVSLDGSEGVHNEVRGHPRAYARAVRGLRALASAGVPSAVICAATARSLPDIPDVYELAGRLNAGLLHLRPLAPEGRGRTLGEGWTLTAEDCTRLFLLAELLASLPDASPRVQLDLVPVASLDAARDQFELLRDSPSIATLSDAINPIVIDPRGHLFPFTYGIDVSLHLGSIDDFDVDAILDPAGEPRRRTTAVLDAAFRGAAGEGMAYLDWFAHLTRVSRLTPASLVG